LTRRLTAKTPRHHLAIEADNTGWCGNVGGIFCRERSISVNPDDERRLIPYRAVVFTLCLIWADSAHVVDLFVATNGSFHMSVYIGGK
jgi:hypothetical protein